MKKCVRYVEALNEKEVEEILVFDKTNQPYVVVEPNLIQKFPENFLWKNDPKVMEGIQESYIGPYRFLILFFEKK